MKEKAPKTGIFIKKGSSKKWYWHLKGKNGKIIASGHGLNTKQNAQKSVISVMRFFKVHFYIDIMEQIKNA
jgi:uncharacterized protein YegP (UPF0339 family)